MFAACFHAVSRLAYFSTLKMEAMIFPKRLLTFNGLQGVIFQKIGIITTDVRFSNPTNFLISSP
jgi:hypothetical protein